MSLACVDAIFKILNCLLVQFEMGCVDYWDAPIKLSLSPYRSDTSALSFPKFKVCIPHCVELIGLMLLGGLLWQQNFA